MIQFELMCKIKRKLQIVVLFALLMKIVFFGGGGETSLEDVQRGQYFRSFAFNAVFGDGKHVLETTYLLEGMLYKIFGS